MANRYNLSGEEKLIWQYNSIHNLFVEKFNLLLDELHENPNNNDILIETARSILEEFKEERGTFFFDYKYDFNPMGGPPIKVYELIEKFENTLQGIIERPELIQLLLSDYMNYSRINNPSNSRKSSWNPLKWLFGG